MLPTKIAIQGCEGSFHQSAAQQFYGKQVQVIPCNTFREVVRTAGDGQLSNGGVLAIENSIAGSILPNYNLLQKSNLKVIGEVYLQINHNLLVAPGVALEDIKEVHSHPMAILQCIDFLEKYNWKLVETSDTASSAKYVHEHNCKHIAAIAGTLAAELFHLDIAAPNIHSLENNYTRFLVLQRPENAPNIEDANKASVYFQTDHSKGSLALVLTKIADADVNLSKLQSFPIPGSDWKYSFHADMEFDSIAQFEVLIQNLQKNTACIEVYGMYKKGW